jgi:hypothetical protein
MPLFEEERAFGGSSSSWIKVPPRVLINFAYFLRCLRGQEKKRIGGVF